MVITHPIARTLWRFVSVPFPHERLPFTRCVYACLSCLCKCLFCLCSCVFSAFLQWDRDGRWRLDFEAVQTSMPLMVQ